ncbi:hypothetical protein, partial [Arthrobacter sp. STN4]|uniref:hypothetical protein n=1 Tax=Arthrobacter sp. STN4 TaxID=2923276 RepID=UPI00211A2CB1
KMVTMDSNFHEIRHHTRGPHRHDIEPDFGHCHRLTEKYSPFTPPFQPKTTAMNDMPWPSETTKHPGNTRILASNRTHQNPEG